MDKHLITLKDYIMWVDGNFYNVVWGESYSLHKFIYGEKSLTVLGEIDLVLNINNIVGMVVCPEPPKKITWNQCFGIDTVKDIAEPHPDVLIIK